MKLKNIFASKDEPKKQELSPEEIADRNLVEDFYTTGMKIRQPYEKQWYYNMAFFLGQQWITWNTVRNSLEIPPAPSWRVRLVSNKIMPTVLHSVAKMTQNRPTYVVIPGSNEDSAVNAAEISRKVLAYSHRINQMDILNQRLILWMIIYGTAFKDPYFDVTAGIRKREPKLDDSEQPIIGTDGQPEMYDITTGEVDCDILSPFSVLWEPGATNLEKSRRIMKVVPMPLEWIRQTWEAGKYVEAEETTQVSSVERQLVRLMGEQFQTETLKEKSGDPKTGYATIKELREKPSKKYPKGRCIRVANGVLLESGDLPYEYMVRRNTLGMVKYDYIELGERFPGKSPVEDMIPLQIDRNKSISQVIENRNLMSRPKWIVAKGHKIERTSLTSEPGEVITYTPYPGAGEPKQVTPASLPNYIFNLLDVTNKDLDDIGLIARVSRGDAPPGVESGIAIQYLQEKDQSVFGPFMTRFEAKEAVAGTYTLEIIKDRYKEQRTLKIVGENNEIEVFDFEAVEDMPTDVYVQSGSSLPSSLAAKQNLILSFFEKGMLGNSTDERVRMRALRLADIGGVDVLFEENATDEREAKRENRLFEKGEVPPINVFDNHALHIFFHDLWRKSDRYRRLVAKNPQIALKAEAHISEHMQKDPAAQAQAAMVAQQDAAIKAQEEQTKLSTETAQAQATSKMIDDVRRREQEDKQPITPEKGKEKNAVK
jgi:hypothetical protein